MKKIISQTSRDFNITRSEAELIIASLLERPRFEIYLNQAIDEKQLGLLKMRLRQYKNGVPLEYLTKKVQFMNRVMKIYPGVFIPRLETEYFIELIVKRLKQKPCNIMEIGTGCGAISITLSSFYPDAIIIATDISSCALNNAQDNMVFHKRENIAFVQADMIDALKGKFDLIVSNPPYIPRKRIGSLPRSVKEFEPLSAIDGGPHGVRLIEKIVKKSDAYLKPQGLLALEIDEEAMPVIESFMKTENIKGEFSKDLFGCVRYLFINQEVKS